MSLQVPEEGNEKVRLLPSSIPDGRKICGQDFDRTNWQLKGKQRTVKLIRFNPYIVLNDPDQGNQKPSTLDEGEFKSYLISLPRNESIPN